jgi:hypothetical protein
MRVQRALPFFLDLVILALVVVGVTRHIAHDAQPRSIAAHGDGSSQTLAR